MPGIFISYRRESTAAFAGRLFDRLSTKFGKDRTFLDLDMIDPGEDFVTVIENKLADSVALVVLIGPDWLICKDNRGRIRLEDPGDFVRLEVSTALRRGARIIPVLMDDAPMPTAQQLPEDLAPLARRQAIEISHARFHQDVTKLIEVLERLINLAEQAGKEQAETARRTREKQAKIARKRPYRRVLLSLLAIAIPVATGAYVWQTAEARKRASAAASREKEINKFLESLESPKGVASKGVASKEQAIHSDAPPAPGQMRKNGKDGLAYVWIPPGAFAMGCSPGDGECRSNEKPQHAMTIGRGFWMGQTEVTREAYRRVMGESSLGEKGAEQFPLVPVQDVSWEQAVGFCKAADRRLPAEAEWEYAARGGSAAARYGPLDEVAWYSGNGLHQVAQKKPNGFGLYDMLGNVSEYTARDSANAAFNPVRGGSSWDGPRGSRASFRQLFQVSISAADMVGFRCAGE